MAGSQTIGSGVAPADNDDALTGCQYVGIGTEHVAFAAPVLLGQEFHGEVNAAQLTTWYLQIARIFSASGQDNRVEVATQVFHWNILADVHIGEELHSLSFHLRETAIDDVLFQFEMRYAIAQQTA